MNIRVQIIQAWPRRHASRALELPDGATVGDALAVAQLTVDEAAAWAIFGERVGADKRLNDGDRLELLRPLVMDPKEARRRRAGRA